MAVLIDTDMLVDLERGVVNPEVDSAIGDEDRAISVITVSELLHGVHRASGAQRTRRRAFVEHLLGGMRAIEITEQVARLHAASGPSWRPKVNSSARTTSGSRPPRWHTGWV